MPGFFGRRRGVAPAIRPATPEPFAPEVHPLGLTMPLASHQAPLLAAASRELAWPAPGAAVRHAPPARLEASARAVPCELEPPARRSFPLPALVARPRRLAIAAIVAPGHPEALGIARLKAPSARRPAGGILFGTPARWRIEAPFAVASHDATDWVRDLRARRTLTPASKIGAEATAHWLARLGAIKRLSPRLLELVGLFDRLPLAEGAEKRLEFDAARLALKYPLPDGPVPLSVVVVARKRSDQTLVLARLHAQAAQP